jgi:hypothetical protein
MPRVKSKSPISLFKLCAEKIASNLDHWCNQSDTELNMCYQESTCSPFDKLRKSSNIKNLLVVK